MTLGPPQQGVVPNTHDNSDFFSSDRLEPPANCFGGEKVAKKGRRSGKNARIPFENKRWCLSGKEDPSCDTGPSSAGGGPNTHHKIIF